MNILGISCYYHDSAACLIKDGVLITAVQEERFNRIKNSSDFPINAINYCIQEGGISFSEIDYVAFYEKPYLKFNRVIHDMVAKFPLSYSSFIRNIPQWLQDRLALPEVLRREIAYKGKVLYIPHHHAHAASTFLVSDFDEACILINDGVGEFATSSIGYVKSNSFKLNHQINYPNSLGLLYTTITTFLGFSANSGEGTTMALASFGQAKYKAEFDKIINIADDGSYTLNQKYFSLNKRKRMYSNHLINLLGEPRKPDSEYEERHKDIAATLQYIVEESLIKSANHLYNTYQCKNLCLAGGVSLNCVANQKILEQTPFENIFIQPGAGDAGAAIGAAFYAYNIIFENPRNFVFKHAYFGPEYTDKEIEIALNSSGLVYNKLEPDALIDIVSDRIISKKTVGWHQGKLEFGPRALGNRSILASAQDTEMVTILNSKIKHREWFRPFAPIVKADKADKYFKMLSDSPFMLLAPQVLEDKKNIIPAVTHIDCTARTQTVDKNINPKLWSLLDIHEKNTGIPVIINTSFNLKAEPIVNTPEQAINDFLKSDMDCLAVGNYFVEKQ
ncbi:MAG: hypothetical protein C0596_12910 [Marinilabiliales bacterium]|nr:MAG: hypothetical protein C0596_12910 [Marinilabiliales bacterium]